MVQVSPPVQLDVISASPGGPEQFTTSPFSAWPELVIASSLEVFNEAQTPPFQIQDSIATNETREGRKRNRRVELQAK